MRAIAGELKIGPSHLSSMRQGKIRPYPPACKRIAQYFGDNTLLVLIAAGWLSMNDLDPETQIKLFAKALEGEPDFLELYKVYEEQGETSAKNS